MKILNLGCGFKTSPSPDIVNVDFSIYLRMKKSRLVRLIAPLLIKGDRLRNFRSLSDNFLVHNIAKGIPFPDNSVDAVYHSHFLEHLDRPVADKFQAEVIRVLKPGGFQRIAVPDFEAICTEYVKHLSACEHDPGEIARHDSYVWEILSASIRRESFSTTQQKPLRRLFENIVLGDARRRGDTHQWMYDRFNLRFLVESAGFKDFVLRKFTESGIPNWNGYSLDLDSTGNEYKPGSLYVEVRK